MSLFTVVFIVVTSVTVKKYKNETVTSTNSVSTFKKLLDTAADWKNSTEEFGCARVWLHRQQ